MPSAQLMQEISRMHIRYGRVLAYVFLAGSLVYFGIFASQAVQYFAMSAWQPVTAQVLQVTTYKSPIKPLHDPFIVRYRYQAAGQTHDGRQDAGQQMYAYVKDAAYAPIRVNPDNPDESALVPQENIIYGNLTFAFGLLCLALYFVLLGYRRPQYAET